MPAALLDTDVFSYLCLIRGHKRFGWRTAYESFLHEVGIGANYAISSITVGEILDGIAQEQIGSERLPLTTKGKRAETQIQRRLAVLKGFIPSKTLSGSNTDIRIAGETIARGIPELASHDRDFLFIEVVCKNELDVILLEMLPDGSPRRKHLSSQHEHRLVNRLETSGIELEVSVAAG